MTSVRCELSGTNKYWISKHRYYELKHFCLQYKGYMLGPMTKLDVTGSQALNALSDDKRWRAKFIKKVAETFAD